MDSDVQAALAFLRKHDVKHTGAREPVEVDLDALDLADGRPVTHEPVGPNWKRPSSMAMLPKIAGHPDHAWLMHERQDKTGKYKPWIFFSKISGKYYRVSDSGGGGYEPMNRPHDPWASPISVRVGSASVQFSGAKLDTIVLLPDLQKTGFLLKQPLDFMDKPASLFVLCAGLRGSAAAADFCARRIHTLLLPKLSGRATVWYDFELVEALTETAKAMDDMLLDSPACFAGCSLAMVLLAGGRLLTASIGNVRCVLCRPPLAAAPARAQASAPGAWTARRLAGTDAHAVCADESADGVRYGCSASLSTLAAMDDDWEREFLRVTRATNSFATLGVGPSDVEAGSAAVRKTYRRRSLLVHPDKVAEERRKDSTALFSKLEAAADVVDACLQEDAAATRLLAEIHAACDEGRVAAEPAAAARLLDVKEGSDKKEVDAAAKKRFEDKLARLQGVARADVERAMKIVGQAKESVLRGTRLWTPPEAESGVRATQALGCRDLKSPEALLGASLAAEVVKLDVGEVAGLALVTEGAESVTDAMIAQRLGEHSPGRPRAAALQIALDAKRAEAPTGGSAAASASPSGAAAGRVPRRRREALSVVCAFFSSNHESSGSAQPAAKRARPGDPAGGPGLPPPAERARVSHVLLRWAGLKGEDEFERPGMPPPERSQAEAERELLELLYELSAARDPRTLAARFKAAVLKRSECSTALNVPHADVGWIEPGGADPAIVTAAFDTPVGGLSDVVVTGRGAHLMYRLG